MGGRGSVEVGGRVGDDQSRGVAYRPWKRGGVGPDLCRFCWVNTPTRTRTGCSGSIFPKDLTCRATRKRAWMRSQGIEPASKEDAEVQNTC